MDMYKCKECGKLYGSIKQAEDCCKPEPDPEVDGRIYVCNACQREHGRFFDALYCYFNFHEKACVYVCNICQKVHRTKSDVDQCCIEKKVVIEQARVEGVECSVYRCKYCSSVYTNSILALECYNHNVDYERKRKRRMCSICGTLYDHFDSFYVLHCCENKKVRVVGEKKENPIEKLVYYDHHVEHSHDRVDLSHIKPTMVSDGCLVLLFVPFAFVYLCAEVINFLIACF